MTKEIEDIKEELPENDLVKLDPETSFKIAQVLLSSETLVPLVSEHYNAPDSLIKSIELQTRVKMLIAAFDHVDTEMDLTNQEPEVMLEMLLAQVTELCETLMPLLSEDDLEKLAIDEERVMKELAVAFAEYTQGVVESDPTVKEKLTQEELDAEIDDLVKRFDEDIQQSLIFNKKEG